MCHHNYTQHSGCGHIHEMDWSPYTLCPAAEQRLATQFLKYPSGARISSALSSPTSEVPPVTQPKRSSAFVQPSKLTRRLASFRSGTNTTQRQSMGAQRRTVSDSAQPRASTSSFGSGNEGSELNIADHELKAVLCAEQERRELVPNRNSVCKRCRRYISDMKEMVRLYDQGGNVKGCRAFQVFLKDLVEE